MLALLKRLQLGDVNKLSFRHDVNERLYDSLEESRDPTFPVRHVGAINSLSIESLECR
jgi:hypothetical protein